MKASAGGALVPTDWDGAEFVSDAKGILTGHSGGDGRDEWTDCSGRHAGTAWR